MMVDNRSVAQWLEHWSPKPAVGGSSPSTPASYITLPFFSIFHISVKNKLKTTNSTENIVKIRLIS